MSVLEEAAKWGLRALRVLPEIVGLWQAVESDNTDAQEEAKADLIQGMRRQQAIEKLGGGP